MSKACIQCGTFTENYRITEQRIHYKCPRCNWRSARTNWNRGNKMKDENYIKRKTMDIEPKWTAILQLVIDGAIPHKRAGILFRACEIADTLRQAQKQGADKIIYTFNKDGSVDSEAVIELKEDE